MMDTDTMDAAMSETETIPVEVRIVGVESVRDCGRLVAMAIVDVTIAGVTFTLQGVRVMRSRDGRVLSVEPPAFRNPRTGESVPCILLPPALSAAIAAEVLAAVQAPPVAPGGPRPRR